MAHFWLVVAVDGGKEVTKVIFHILIAYLKILRLVFRPVWRYVTLRCFFQKHSIEIFLSVHDEIFPRVALADQKDVIYNFFCHYVFKPEIQNFIVSPVRNVTSYL